MYIEQQDKMCAPTDNFTSGSPARRSSCYEKAKAFVSEYWRVLYAEINYAKEAPLFCEKEPSGQVFDLGACFSPKPKWRSLLLKVTALAIGLSTLVCQLYDRAHPEFYMAYATTWALLTSLAYFLLSISTTIFAVKELSVHAKCTWAFFSAAACAEGMVTLMYWMFDSRGDNNELNYGTLMAHGGVWIIVLLDGLAINRIPVPVKHFIFVEAFVLVYVLWTIVHAVSGMDNPDAPKEDSSDGNERYVYPNADWVCHPFETSLIVLGLLLVISPLLFLVTRHLSLYPCTQINRRYLAVANPEKPDSAERTLSDLESGGSTSSDDNVSRANSVEEESG